MTNDDSEKWWVDDQVASWNELSGLVGLESAFYLYLVNWLIKKLIKEFYLDFNLILVIFINFFS